MKQLLIFPPGWSLNVGSPHLALPLLRSALEEKGLSVRMRDLNWEIAESYGVRINLEEATHAVKLGTMDALNAAYFDAEDKLMEIAKGYNGEWNLQLGFKFNRLSFRSSEDVQEASKSNSPFTEYFKREVLPWVEYEDPALIGFSISSTYQIISALHLCWLLREAGYSGLITFGGNTISRLKQEIVKMLWLFDLVDGFIIFQGELSLIALADSISIGRNLGNVPNLIWRNNGTIQENRVIHFQNPNAFPTPDFEELPVGKYWGVNYLPVLAARGCYYGKCNFCAIPYGYGNRGFSGIRSTELVFRDIINLENKYSMHRYKFMDEAVPPATLKQLSDLILKEKIQIEWEGFVRLECDWLNKTFVNKLWQSGFKKGSFGLEIYPDEKRGNLRKNDNADEILEVLKNCHEAKIKVHLFCMFGFPATGRGEAEKTIEFILKYKHLIDSVDLNPYTYAKHTIIAGIEKIVKPDEDLALEYEYKSYGKGSLSSKEVEELTAEMEDVVWLECPRLLHPTYRLVSPWNLPRTAQKLKEKGYVLAVSH